MNAYKEIAQLLQANHFTIGEASNLRQVLDVRTLTDGTISAFAIGPFVEGERECVTARRNEIHADMKKLEESAQL